VYSLLTVLVWGVWGVLFSQTKNVSAGQSQAYSTLGLLPVIGAAACMDGFRSGALQMRGAMLAGLAGVLVGAGNAAYYQAVSLAKTSTTVSFTMLYPLVLGLAIACLLMWGVSALLMKLATEGMSAAQATFWFLIAFIPLAVWILVARPSAVFDKPLIWNPGLHDWIIMLLLGLTFGIGNLTLLAAYRHDGKASVVTPLAGLYPAVSIPLAVFCLGESIEAIQWVGIAVAIVSAMALVYEKAPDHDCTRVAEQ
jgi:drug/metabolite transporter (DMT)-like permease